MYVIHWTQQVFDLDSLGPFKIYLEVEFYPQHGEKLGQNENILLTVINVVTLMWLM